MLRPWTGPLPGTVPQTGRTVTCPKRPLVTVELSWKGPVRILAHGPPQGRRDRHLVTVSPVGRGDCHAISGGGSEVQRGQTLHKTRWWAGCGAEQGPNDACEELFVLRTTVCIRGHPLPFVVMIFQGCCCNRARLGMSFSLTPPSLCNGEGGFAGKGDRCATLLTD